MAVDTNVQEMLKEHYEDPTEVLFDPDDKLLTPGFAICEMNSRAKEGLGRKLVIPTEYSEGSAASASATVSDTIAADGAAGSNPLQDRWEVTPVLYDGSFTFTREDIDACEGPGEQFKVITNRIDHSLMRVRKRFMQYIWGDGTGALCQIDGIGADYVTVKKYDLNRFKVGDRLTAATAPSGGTAYGTGIRVTGVERSTRKLTLSADPTATWANNSALYLFFEGDRGAVITGMFGWVDPTSTSFFGITRTNIPELTGYSESVSGLTTIEGLTELADIAFSYGIPVQKMFVSSVTWKLLSREKDFQKNVSTSQVGNEKYTIGFQSFNLAWAGGTVPVVPDVYLPATKCAVGAFDDKRYKPRFYHNHKDLVTIEGHDNLEFRRSTTAGSRTYSGNCYFRGQLVMTPGKFLTGTGLPTS